MFLELLFLLSRLTVVFMGIHIYPNSRGRRCCHTLTLMQMMTLEISTDVMFHWNSIHINEHWIAWSMLYLRFLSRKWRMRQNWGLFIKKKNNNNVKKEKKKHSHKTHHPYDVVSWYIFTLDIFLQDGVPGRFLSFFISNQKKGLISQ